MTSAKRSELVDEVVHWLQGYLGLGASTQLNDQTRINLDLGVDGDDGVDLLQAFGKQFSVDVSDFPFGNYFGPEAGTNPVALLRGAWGLLTGRKARALEPLRVLDLVDFLRDAKRR